MRYSFTEFLTRNLSSIGVAAFLLLSALAMSGDAALKRTTRANQLAGNSNIGFAQRREVPETELITITSRGSEPTEITRPAGEFFLDVDNRSEIEEVELRLDRETGGRERSARVRSTAPEWRGKLDLPPGVYILSEANHPSWICRITLTR